MVPRNGLKLASAIVNGLHNDPSIDLPQTGDQEGSQPSSDRARSSFVLMLY